MSKVSYSRGALVDIEQLAEFLRATDPQATDATGRILMEAITMLSRHPLVGPIVESGPRELVISRGQFGYVALYRFEADADQVFILAIRYQREF